MTVWYVMIMVGAIAAFWILGLVCALMPVPALETQFFAGSVACIGVAFLATLYNIYKHGAALPKTPLVLTGLLFWAVALNSVLWSEVQFESYLYFWFFSAFPLSFLIFSLPPEKEKLFLYCGSGAGMIVATLAVINFHFYLLAPEWLHHGQSGWPFADPNSLAALLSFGFFAALGGMLYLDKMWQKKILLFVALFLFAILLTTGSRAALLALIISALVFAVFNRAHVKRHWACFAGVAAGIAIVFAALYFITPSTSIGPGSIISTASLANVMDARPAMWASTWEIIKTHFWTGTGIGTFYLYYPEVRGADYGTAGLHAHNDPLEFFSDMGVAAPVLFYTFIVMAIVRTFKALKNTAPDDKSRIAILTPFCALAAMIVHTHVEFNFYVLPTLMISGLLLAFWFYETEKVLKDNIVPVRWPSAGMAFFALVFALGCAAFLSSVMSNLLVEKAQIASEAGDLEAFAAAVNDAGKLSRHQNASAYLLAARVPMGLLENGVGERDALIKQAEGLLVKASDLNPRSAAIVIERARLEELKGEVLAFATLLRDAVTLNPLYLPARLKLAEHLRALGKEEEAFKILKDGLRWAYNDPDAVAYFDETAATAAVFGDAETAQLAREMKDRHLGRLGLQAKRQVFSTAM